MQRGGDRRSEDAKSKPPCGGVEQSRSPSARRTAALLRCSTRTVERARRIRKDGTDAILKALEKHRMTIYQADKAIAEKANGQPPVSEALDDMVQLTPENLERLKNLGGNRFAHVNTALHRYLDTEFQQISESQGTNSDPGGQ
ncbi:MAG: hypothetical protein V1792_01100, partial [Pseudomonadota bacterium]